MPMPRSSSKPASAGAGPHQQPAIHRFHMRAVVGDKARKRQSPACAACSSASARRDLPDPERPRISTALAPTSTAEAWRCDWSRRRQANDEARAEHLRSSPPRRRRRCGSPPRCARHAPRRSVCRSKARGRNSGRSPGAAGRYRSARKCDRTRPGACPGPSSSTTISTSLLSRRQVTRTVPPGGEKERALSIRLPIT